LNQLCGEISKAFSEVEGSDPGHLLVPYVRTLREKEEIYCKRELGKKVINKEG
jgi:hypothetical protein